MGVIDCHRNGCTEIMCKTQTYEVGNICGGCKSEFMSKFGDYFKSKNNMIKKLKKFMNTEKEYKSDVVKDYYGWNYFNENSF